MLADAIRSEAYRFSKNRMGVFWSVLFVPVLFLVIGSISYFFIKARTEELTAQIPELAAQVTQKVDLGQSLVASAADFANPMTLLFILIGVATLYAGDYRWETWRLTSARNSRPNLILGKLAVVLGVTLAALLVWVVFGTVSEVIKSAILDLGLTFTFDGERFGQLLAMSGLTIVRVIQFTMIGLLAAVFTRSLLAALFVPLVVGVGQFFLSQSLGLLALEPSDWLAQLTMPGLGVEALKTVIQDGFATTNAPDGIVLKAIIGLTLWTLIPLAAALAWFKRQDLSKE